MNKPESTSLSLKQYSSDIKSESKEIYILAVETSCDETAAAVVKNGKEVLSNVISSQIALHTVYGGVVPEIASRNHIKKIDYVLAQALRKANMRAEEVDAIAVTSDRKSTRLNSSHTMISYAVFCLKKKTSW